MDANGTKVWSTDTNGNPALGLNLTENGNLVIFGKSNETIWQSFDHLTYTLPPGQLMLGQTLNASISKSNFEEGSYSVKVDDNYFASAYFRSSIYWYEYARGANLSEYLQTDEFLKFEPDGHLRTYGWSSTNEPYHLGASSDVFAPLFGSCAYSLACGRYGVCDDDDDHSFHSLVTTTSYTNAVYLKVQNSSTLHMHSHPWILQRHAETILGTTSAFIVVVLTIIAIYLSLVRNKKVQLKDEEEERLLVYEHMANGSLDKWIFNGKQQQQQEHGLTWQTKKKIMSDVAKGLAYLHEDCNHTIIHLDIKPQNILLDQNFNAKVADFGLSKLVAKDQSKVVTTPR
nr:G-type lectin S-receptor-like serine/threonine-protein kinase SD2-5 [Ipomoea batatas]